MNTSASSATLKTTYLTVWVSQNNCCLLRAGFNSAPKDFQRITTDLGIDIIEELPFYIGKSSMTGYVRQCDFNRLSEELQSIINKSAIRIEDKKHSAKQTVNLSISLTGCYIRQSAYNNLPSFARDVLNNLNIPTIEDIPVDICYYWWDDFSEGEGESSMEAQKSEKLHNFTKSVDTISGPWLLNQERFLKPVPDGEEIPHPLIHIPYDFVSSKEDLLKHFPRYAYIMDDSIWNYLLLQDEDFQNHFDDILTQIRRIIKAGYYYLNIAYEYAHLKARIVREAFILNNGDLGNHGAHISPFLFHSEKKMSELNSELQEKVYAIRQHEWRFLLLDDKHSDSLAIVSTCNNKPSVNKRQILENRLNRILDTSSYYLECVATVSEAFTALSDKRYDVVFVDYLLEDDYGYKLLSDIWDECEPAEKSKVNYPQYVGPGGRLFFMFTSAFTTAVSERLVLEGMNRSKDFWYIGEGACPTNTPQLFEYYLINILDKRIQDSGISDLSADEVYKLLFTIFKPKGGDEKLSVRKRANDNYQKVLSLQYHYHRLLKDVDENKGSRLVTHFITNHTHLGGLLEHLVQLVHITAFGSVRQWPEMWEEYLFCKAQFDDFFLGPEPPINNAKATQELNRTIKSFNHKEQERYDYRVQLLDAKDQTLENKLELAKRTRLNTLYQYIEQHILSLQSL